MLLSKMSHANVVAFRESFEDENLLCIVMEYCSGGDLLQRIQRQKQAQFSLEEVLRWFAQMCAGAKHIHDKRVLHRDLKSKNIFLTEDGTIKLGDFGSACVLNSPKAFAQTYVGTPYYVAPEIWDNQPYNNKSDVWALGCVLYELCTLRHPFQARSWKSLILKVCRGAYPPLPRHLPYELHYLLKHMFKTDPRDRPSLHTILTSHRASRLLRAHLPPEAVGSGQDRARTEGRRVRTWSPQDGDNVLKALEQKSLMHTSASQGLQWSHADSESSEVPHRKHWAPSESALQRLADASLMSAGSSCRSETEEVRDKFCRTEEPRGSEPRDSEPRRRWDRAPPQRLLSVLEKAPLHRAFSTFIIHPAGPLCDPAGDDPDGPTQVEVDDVDEERLQPRSDDDDTDFEEDSPCDWISELEDMLYHN